jgi:serine protease
MCILEVTINNYSITEESVFYKFCDKNKRRGSTMKQRYVLFCCFLGVLFCIFPGSVFAQPGYEEVIVNFTDDAGQEEIELIEKEYGFDLVYNSVFSKEEVLLRFPVSARTADELRELMKSLTAEEEIEYAEPNYLYQASFIPNDPRYKEQWHMKMINVEEAWDSATGDGAIVAVIDTGVAFEDYKDKKGTYHRVPDLAKTKFVKGYDFIDDDEHANDDNGHGTHVAGTIAQSTNNKLGVVGVAHKASIMPLKVLTRQGYGNAADIAEAVVYAADHGAHVINMSLGGAFPTAIMREAVEYAYKKGVTVVCAAGNAGNTAPHYPAAYQYAIAVSSVGPDGELAPYSSHGNWIDIAAPGGNTRQKREHGVLQNTIGRMDPTKDSYEFFQGTSMASPHVAGVAALVVSTGVKEPKKVQEILLKTATKKDDKTKYGAGIVNAGSAVKAAKSADTVISQAALGKKPPVTFKESMIYFIAGVGFAILYFKLLNRSDGWGKIFSFLFTLAMLLTSSGLFFVEFLPIPVVPRSVIHFISSPIPNLDRVLLGHTSMSINPLFHSALLPLILIIVLLGTKRGKALALGVAVGMASHLFVDTFFSIANVVYVPDLLLLDKLWLLLNGVFCFGLAVLAGKKS